ncbi:expressed unknown protein [Seminavis robusta]|uniref:Uncharacterized protein n=1 Tax=Seminavis robusta TaxID=568900 RepID=A0A9N8ELT2_9STRA|nr:expressed unknown protein [Seminavis robusta]|eukprot:Sro1298_g260580.1 n/a (568) ;mRNA; f:6749-8452
MVDTAAVGSNNKQRGVRGDFQKRRLHPHSVDSSRTSKDKSKKSKKADADGGRAGGFFTGTGGWVNPKHGEPGHIHGWKKGDEVPADATRTSPIISNSMGSITTQTSQLATYADKCDAAQAGAEFHTSSYVPVYYQYEILTSTTRNILDVADIVDKAIQHFLAIWLVDCDTTSVEPGNTRRQRALMEEQVYSKFHDDDQRKLQLTLEPIVGTGVGEWDIVLMGGTAADKCSSEFSTMALLSTDLICYKVIGSTYVYLDTTMTVTPKDIETIALETLTVGMNLASTDFTGLDPDIYDLNLVSGYEAPPTALIASNRPANQRAWDDGLNNNSETPIESPPTYTSGRSGGAKFGIAFAILACITLVAFAAVYMWKNHDHLLDDYQRRNKKKGGKHFNLDEVTLPSTRYEPETFPSKANVSREDGPSHGEMNVTLRSVTSVLGGRAGYRAERAADSPSSTGTRPLSPEPATPRHHSVFDKSIFDEHNVLVEESNIVSPRSERSAISDVSGVSSEYDNYRGKSYSAAAQTPDDRIRTKRLSKGDIRRSFQTMSTPSQMVSPDRAYEMQDTVDL